MKKFLFSVCCLLACLASTGQNSTLTLLVGTYTDTDSKGIYSFAFDQETGDSSPLAVTEIANPSFLTVTPDNRRVYVVSEQQKEASVSAFGYNPAKGTLRFKNSKPTEGKDPCHVTFTGKEVTVTNYSSGSLTVFPLKRNGRLKEGTLLEFFENGPDKSRQSGSHIHSSQVSPDGKYLFVIDLGGDYIYRYPVSGGKVASFDPVKIKVPAGQGPRHFEFSVDGRFMYLGWEG